MSVALPSAHTSLPPTVRLYCAQYTPKVSSLSSPRTPKEAAGSQRHETAGDRRQHRSPTQILTPRAPLRATASAWHRFHLGEAVSDGGNAHAEPVARRKAGGVKSLEESDVGELRRRGTDTVQGEKPSYISCWTRLSCARTPPLLAPLRPLLCCPTGLWPCQGQSLHRLRGRAQACSHCVYMGLRRHAVTLQLYAPPPAGPSWEPPRSGGTAAQRQWPSFTYHSSAIRSRLS